MYSLAPPLERSSILNNAEVGQLPDDLPAGLGLVDYVHHHVIHHIHVLSLLLRIVFEVIKEAAQFVVLIFCPGQLLALFAGYGKCRLLMCFSIYSTPFIQILCPDNRKNMNNLTK